MNSFIPYLNFDGHTRDVMTFYQQCLGAELTIQTFADAHIPSPGNENRVMHARLSTSSGAVLMASDSMPDMPVTVGNNVWITQDCESVEEIERLFAGFSEGGHVIMPLADQFWGARFGMLTDKYGINWMFNHEMKQD